MIDRTYELNQQLHARVQTLEAENAKLRECRALVADLAEGGEPAYWDAYQDRRCALCGEVVPDIGAHDPDCLWLKAKQLVQS